jgi:coenzyme F420-reducing hydrogenase beta subunit
MYEPTSSGGVDAASVCPSIAVDYACLQTKRFGQAKARSIGVVESILLAQSMDRERNLRASSGGVIKEILLEGLSRREIDGVIALSHRRGICFEPDSIRSSEDVDRLPASIYHNVPFDNALKILMGRPARYALVATPCQLEGIYKLIYTFRPDLAERVALSIGLICGWTYSHHAIKAICTFTGIDFDRIENIAYRGAGPVGHLRIETPTRTSSINRRRNFHYIVAFDRSFNLPRCHLCVNHLNYLADIVVGDAWLSRVAGTTAGVSLVICRAKKTADIMNRISEAGNIRLAEACEADLVESQSRNFVYGDFAYAYAHYLESIGRFTPRLIGPNRDAAVLPPITEVSRFHRTYMRKVRMQQQGAYRRLWIRKLFFDVAGYAWRLTRKLLKQAPSRSTRRKPDGLSSPAGPFR